MAKNYTVVELFKTVRAGKDMEAIIDIGRRYPVLATLANSVNDAAMTVLGAIPDYITARKVEKGLHGEVDETETADASDDDDKPVKKSTKKVAEDKPAKKPVKKVAKKEELEDDDDADEDEDDEEEEKPAKKSTKKPAKKSKSDDDDDDDDFDFE